MRSEPELRRMMVEVGRWMWERNFIAGTNGNLSARLDSAHILTTPAGFAKGRMEESDLVVTDLEGSRVRGDNLPSSELKIHLAAYRRRPEIGAVVHAHPKAAIAHSLARLSMAAPIIPETICTLGIIAAAAYETPGSESLAEAVERTLVDHDAVVMERHGTVTLGNDLVHAYDRLESLEHTAQILYMAHTLGSVDPLPEAEVGRLAGLTGSRSTGADPTARAQEIDRETVNQLVRMVIERMS